MSKFKVGDKVSFNDENWIIEQPCLLGGWILRHAVNKYRSAVVSDNDLILIQPAPEPITVYAVYDEKGEVIEIFMNRNGALREITELSNTYTIRPATLTLTEVKE